MDWISGMIWDRGMVWIREMVGIDDYIEKTKKTRKELRVFFVLGLWVLQ